VPVLGVGIENRDTGFSVCRTGSIYCSRDRKRRDNQVGSAGKHGRTGLWSVLL